MPVEPCVTSFVSSCWGDDDDTSNVAIPSSVVRSDPSFRSNPSASPSEPTFYPSAPAISSESNQQMGTYILPANAGLDLEAKSQAQQREQGRGPDGGDFV